MMNLLLRYPRPAAVQRRAPRLGRPGALLLLLALVLGGCDVKPGIIFPPVAGAPQWPGPPEPTRIAWVGQLESDTDLKPGVSGLEAFGQAVFGKKPAHSMLTPFALCTDAQGGKEGTRLFVADSNAQLVHVFNLITRKYEMWKPGKKEPVLSQPVGIAWDADAPGPKDGPAGRLLVADSVAGTIFVFGATGKYVGQLGAGLLQRPCGLAIEPGTRRIVVADAKAHQVIFLEPDGREALRIGSRGTKLGEFNFPTAVTFDTQGQLYVCDALNFRIQQFDHAYKAVRSVGKKGDLPGYFAQPKGLALDGEDHLYVLDSQFENVQLFDDHGRLLMDFGHEGRGPGEFWLPTGIFIERKPDGAARIWLADSYNRRVQVFNYLPLALEVKP